MPLCRVVVLDRALSYVVSPPFSFWQISQCAPTLSTAFQHPMPPVSIASLPTSVIDHILQHIETPIARPFPPPLSNHYPTFTSLRLPQQAPLWQLLQRLYHRQSLFADVFPTLHALVQVSSDLTNEIKDVLGSAIEAITLCSGYSDSNRALASFLPHLQGLRITMNNLVRPRSSHAGYLPAILTSLSAGVGALRVLDLAHSGLLWVEEFLPSAFVAANVTKSLSAVFLRHARSLTHLALPECALVRNALQQASGLQFTSLSIFHLNLRADTSGSTSFEHTFLAFLRTKTSELDHIVLSNVTNHGLPEESVSFRPDISVSTVSISAPSTHPSKVLPRIFSIFPDVRTLNYSGPLTSESFSRYCNYLEVFHWAPGKLNNDSTPWLSTVDSVLRIIGPVLHSLVLWEVETGFYTTRYWVGNFPDCMRQLRFLSMSISDSNIVPLVSCLSRNDRIERLDLHVLAFVDPEALGQLAQVISLKEYLRVVMIADGNCGASTREWVDLGNTPTTILCNVLGSLPSQVEEVCVRICHLDGIWSEVATHVCNLLGALSDNSGCKQSLRSLRLEVDLHPDPSTSASAENLTSSDAENAAFVALAQKRAKFLRDAEFLRYVELGKLWSKVRDNLSRRHRYGNLLLQNLSLR